MFKRITRFINAKKQRRNIAIKLHDALIEQSLQRWFFDVLGVKDTLTGRFDLVVLHAHLVFERLDRDKDHTGNIAQQLFDILFKQFDIALREEGVGDMSIGKHIKAMAQGFYGRAQNYSSAFEQSDDRVLWEALKRNLALDTPEEEALMHVSAYLRRYRAILADAPGGDFSQGRLPRLLVHEPGGEL